MLASEALLRGAPKRSTYLFVVLVLCLLVPTAFVVLPSVRADLGWALQRSGFEDQFGFHSAWLNPAKDGMSFYLKEVPTNGRLYDAGFRSGDVLLDRWHDPERMFYYALCDVRDGEEVEVLVMSVSELLAGQYERVRLLRLR